MPVITLTSDWKQNDFYLAAVKGQLLSYDDNLKLVDFNHQINPFNIAQAAFILKNSFHYFPKNSIHLIYIDAEPSETRKYMAVKALDHFFVGTDNGLFSLILNEEKSEIVELKNLEKSESQSFPGLHTFTHAAYQLSQGTKLNELGDSLPEFSQRMPMLATIEANVITGSILYIDSYGNAITNITKELFDRIGHNNSFEIFVQSKHYTLDEITTNYNIIPPGELLAVFNTSGLLEIAINRGNASRLLNLNQNSTIRIEFLI